MRILAALLFLICTVAYGNTITAPFESQYLNYPNLVTNPGFENGKAKWVFGAGPTTIITATTANVGKGLYALSWDSTAAAQIFNSTLTPIPAGLYGRNCLARIKYKGGTNETWEVSDGGATIASGTLTNSASYVQQTLTFVCPTSGSLQIKVTSTADGVVLYVDDTFIGENYLVGDDVFNPDALPWKVDANISGNDVSLGTVNVTSYSEMINSGLTLTNNSGVNNISAQIPCSGVNPPTGTTCAVGSESVGVSFSVPVAGDVLACVSFSHESEIGFAVGNSSVQSIFQIVETPTNAQTNLALGKTRIGSTITNPSNNTTPFELNHPLRVCGNFSFASTGTKVLRLMYEQRVLGTITNSEVAANAAGTLGQRDIHWEVYPVNQLIPSPVLVNSILSLNSTPMRLIRGSVTPGAGACTINNGEGFTVADGAAGECGITFSTAFATTPSCVSSIFDGTVGTCGLGAVSTTGASTRARDAAFAQTDGLGCSFMCIGPR
jgi:hypothetical protein